MKIPENPLLRESFYQELIRHCLVSRQNRKDEYMRLRSYFLFGAGTDAQPATYNKIEPAIDLLTSFLFAVDTTKFNIELGAGVDPKELPKVLPLSKRLNDKWQDSSCDITFSNSVTWSEVYGTVLIKLIQRGRETHPFLVEPGDFGVLEEHIPMLDRQQAFVHVYMTTRSQLERDLTSTGHAKREQILSRVSARRTHEDQLPAGVQRVIIASTYPLSGTMTGNVNAPLSAIDMYRPQTDEELIEMNELWMWDDDIKGGGHPITGAAGGWRVVTMTDPTICVYDRPAGELDKKGTNIFLPGEHPFTAVCPNPAPDYFWGYSQVQRLILLQDLREHHLAQVNNLIDRQVTPPKSLQGLWGAVEEKDAALQRLGAILSSQDPTAKIVEHKPQMPTDMWAVIAQIDRMFDDTIAANNLSRGQGDSGVRSEGQTTSLLRVGTSRPKKRALVIEDSLERIATTFLRLDQAHDPDPLFYDAGDGKGAVKFTSAQFTEDYMVKVDGHSSSPIFMEDMKNEAKWLLQAGVIDGDSYLDMTQPQNVQVLKARYKKMAEAKALAAANEAALRKAEVEGKVAGRIGGK